MRKRNGQSKEKGLTPPTDSERETRVLLEEVRSDVKTVAEQHGFIVVKLKEHDGEFLKIHGRFDRLEQRFTHLEQQFGKLDNQFATAITDHERRLRNVEGKFA